MTDRPASDRRPNPQQVRLMLVGWAGISLLVVMCIVLASDFSEVNSAAGQQPLPTPSRSPVGDLAIPTVPSSFGYGIQVNAELGDLDSTFMAVEQLGLNWVKQQVRWASMQPTPDDIRWETLDAFIASADSARVNVLLSIVDAPEWTRASTSSGRTGPPDNLRDYVNFVVAVLERYPGQVQAIEVWNEQNLQREWYSVGGLSAARYVELLALTYESVKAVDPNVIVVSGALSPTGVNDGIVAVDDFVYMDQMLAAGLLAYADCVGAHHTGVNLPPDITAEEAFADGPPPDTVFLGPYDQQNSLNPHHSWSFRSTLLGQYEKVVDAGGTQKLCVTEFGWPSMEGLGTDRVPPEFEFAWDNSLAEQAAYSVQAYQLLREWGIAEMAFLWNLNFATETKDTLSDNDLYSLVGPDGTPRPAFYAISAMPKD